MKWAIIFKFKYDSTLVEKLLMIVMHNGSKGMNNETNIS